MKSLLKKKSCIIFDLADTLIELDPSPQFIISKFFLEQYSTKLEEEEIKRSLVFLSNIFHYSSVNFKNKLSKKKFYLNFNKHLLDIMGVSHISSPETIYNHISRNQSRWVLKLGVCKLLNDLKNANFKIALLSNFNYQEAINILSSLEIKDYFDYLHISEKEGLEKPDIEFYKLFFAKNNIRIEDCLYCGDSYTLDFIPSNKINLSFVLIDELNLFKQISNRIDTVSKIINL